MSLIIFTVHKWPLLPCVRSYCKSCPQGCGCSRTGLRRTVGVRKLMLAEEVCQGSVVKFTGHNPKLGMKELLFCSVFKLGVCPARDSQPLTWLERTWKENLSQPRSGEECQVFWKHCQNTTISQNFQRCQRSVCISMEKVLKALETIPSFFH